MKLERKPRMADFAAFAVAAEQGRVEGPRFLDAYRAARDEGRVQAVESSIISAALFKLMEVNETYEATATDLLERLTFWADDQAKRTPYWPKNARSLSNELRRLAPVLPSIGLSVDFNRRTGGERLVAIRKVGENSVTSVTNVTPNVDGQDEPPRPASLPSLESVQQQLWSDASDGSDASSPALSSAGGLEPSGVCKRCGRPIPPEAVSLSFCSQQCADAAWLSRPKVAR